jgi:hypothetical protein
LFADNLFNAQGIVFIITNTIDFFVVFIISISAFQTVIPIVIYVTKVKRKKNIAIKSFINSLLLALELESANAVLKMGLFTSITISTDNIVSGNINNFIFFISLLSVRILINQTLRRCSIDKYVK